MEKKTREDLDKESLQLKELVDQVIKSSTLLAEEKDLSINSKLSKNLPDVMVDRQGISRVVTNLIDNAIKYTSSGNISVSLQQKNSELEFSVKDSGIGIDLPEDQYHKLFERFYQEKTTNIGTGIGLSICKAIIEAHGGKLRVKSKGRDKGSTFSFTLPLVTEKEPITIDTH
jgi:signal transduction histidine kinase